MSKIAIISQPDQGVLIDVSGCTTLEEAAHHLTSTLQISSQFWHGLNIELNLGGLKLNPEEVAQIISIAAEVGVKPYQVFAQEESTRQALAAQHIKVGSGEPMTLPVQPATVEVQVSEGNEAPSPATTAGNDSTAPSITAPPSILYLRQTLRSGQAVSHQGHLVIIGDVNPGAEVMAEGDITIWGALRGVAHAGISGNIDAQIRALRLQPIQLRIGHAIARSPDSPRKTYSSNAGPETARIVNGTIRITANNPD